MIFLMKKKKKRIENRAEMEQCTLSAGSEHNKIGGQLRNNGWSEIVVILHQKGHLAHCPLRK